MIPATTAGLENALGDVPVEMVGMRVVVTVRGGRVDGEGEFGFVAVGVPDVGVSGVSSAMKSSQNCSPILTILREWGPSPSDSEK